MSLELTINGAIKTAMLAKAEAELRALRAIKAAILVAKTAEGASGELTDADEQKLLQKLAKQRKDSIEIFRQQNRTDLAVKEEEELAVIERYLPKQLTEDELRAEVSAIISAVGASGPADMGKVMGAATKQLAGKADGKAISALVKELLTK
ncbi:GatB/YqeY domain-containing protein [Chitinophaga deserti]|uniref:GatB/YqeY domain-containing protein n=1 Tax=Chitinophaga deserti TaxID=2164099 RepID=UPI000D6C2E94|nr:GatB/YqeY domain-containing protein [Chitinophaga deserti]